MAHTVTKIEKWTCDVCGNECNPLVNVQIPISTTKDFTNTLNIKVDLDFPYTRKKDVCECCFKNIMKEWLKEKD